jgi:predicted nucleic acid-binding protein
MVSRSLVVDCSATLPWFIPVEREQHSEALLKNILDGYTEMIVPDLWWYETMNVIWNSVLRKRIIAEDAQQLFLFLRQIPKKVIEVGEAGQFGILKLSIDESLSIYDATYLFTAIITGSQLITPDRDLLKLTGKYPIISDGIE